MVFNPKGIKVTDCAFSVRSIPLNIVDSYQYLGIQLKPSGSMHFAPVSYWPNLTVLGLR